MLHIYIRVSHKTQDTASQEPDLRRWVTANGQPFEWWEEKHTGKLMDRPVWKRLIAKLLPGDTVIVWRLDRLGRTTSGLTSLFDDFIARRINLVSMREGIDLQTPAGRLTANVLASVAQFEIEVRRERTSAGIAAARAKGRRWGGSKIGRKMKSRASTEQVNTIHLLRSQGQRIAAIARAVGLSRQTTYRYLPTTA